MASGHRSYPSSSFPVSPSLSFSQPAFASSLVSSSSLRQNPFLPSPLVTLSSMPAPVPWIALAHPARRTSAQPLQDTQTLPPARARAVSPAGALLRAVRRGDYQRLHTGGRGGGREVRRRGGVHRWAEWRARGGGWTDRQKGGKKGRQAGRRQEGRSKPKPGQAEAGPTGGRTDRPTRAPPRPWPRRPGAGGELAGVGRALMGRSERREGGK